MQEEIFSCQICFQRFTCCVLQDCILILIENVNAGWLGWVYSWGEATKSFSMGDWTTNNFPNVSISISPKAQAAMDTRTTLFPRQASLHHLKGFDGWFYHINSNFRVLHDFSSLSYFNLSLYFALSIGFRHQGWWSGNELFSYVAKRRWRPWNSISEPSGNGCCTMDAAKSWYFHARFAKWCLPNYGYCCVSGDEGSWSF